MSRPGENYRPYSLTGLVFWRIGHTAVSFFRGLRESALWGWQAAREDFSKQPPRQVSSETRRPILTLLLVVVPIAVVATLGRAEWFINWPVMFAASIILAQLLRGPLAEAPSFLRKCVKLAISFCLLIAFTKLLYWKPLWAMLAPAGAESSQARAWIMVVSVLAWWVAVFWIIFSRPRAVAGVAQSRSTSEGSTAGASSVSAVSELRFSDVGGMEEAKEQIQQLVRGQLEPAKYKSYGVVRNGILLYGPRGSGKTFLAEATAGEFGLPYHYLSPTKLITTWVGETERALRNAFAEAATQRPVVFLIDELDCLGTTRQSMGGAGDPGGGGRSYNSIAIELMQCIDRYRRLPGFVLMAATNVLDGLDEALTRPGRF